MYACSLIRDNGQNWKLCILVNLEDVHIQFLDLARFLYIEELLGSAFLEEQRRFIAHDNEYMIRMASLEDDLRMLLQANPAIRTDINFLSLINRIRQSSQLLGALLELQVAVASTRDGRQVDFFPQIPGSDKYADFRMNVASQWLYFEATCCRLSDKEQNLRAVLSEVYGRLKETIGPYTLRLTLHSLPSSVSANRLISVAQAMQPLQKPAQRAVQDGIVLRMSDNNVSGRLVMAYKVKFKPRKIAQDLAEERPQTSTQNPNVIIMDVTELPDDTDSLNAKIQVALRNPANAHINYVVLVRQSYQVSQTQVVENRVIFNRNPAFRVNLDPATLAIR